MYTELVRHQPEPFAIHLNTSGLNWLGLLKIYYPIQHIMLSALTAKMAQSHRPKHHPPFSRHQNNFHIYLEYTINNL